jgi:hypothetical protein
MLNRGQSPLAVPIHAASHLHRRESTASLVPIGIAISPIHRTVST